MKALVRGSRLSASRTQWPASRSVPAQANPNIPNFNVRYLFLSKCSADKSRGSSPFAEHMQKIDLFW
jgi:hypothetical protein